MSTTKLTYRQLNLDADLAALTTLYQTLDTEASEATILDEIRNWEQDTAKDRWVVEAPDDPNQLIAQAWIAMQTKGRVYTYIDVLPEWRRQGIGSVLLAHLKVRAQQMEAVDLMGGGSLDQTEAQAFLKHYGFEPAGNNRTFIAPPDVAIPEPTWPTGFYVRSFAETQSLSQLATVQNLSYHDMWGHWENVVGAVTAETLSEVMEKYPEAFIHKGIFIVFDANDDLAGVCYGRVGPEADVRQKIVDSPGVVPKYRHLELQRPLTLHTMRWLRNNYGPGPIEVETYGEHDDVLPIYEALGFTLEPENHWVEYRLILD